VKKRIIAAILAVVTLSTIAVIVNPTTAEAKKAKSSAERSMSITEAYQQQLETAVPYPLDAMKDSLERRNLREKLLRYNKPDKISYIYLLSDTGSVITFYPIKGKVSSNQSQMTAADIDRCHVQREQGCSVLEGPGDDGSYGPNEDGIFFFTTENVMVTWNGKYLLADAPLKVSSAPIITYNAAEANPSSVGGGQ
jgi:hypothetical protein